LWLGQARPRPSQSHYTWLGLRFLKAESLSGRPNLGQNNTISDTEVRNWDLEVNPDKSIVKEGECRGQMNLEIYRSAEYRIWNTEVHQSDDTKSSRQCKSKVDISNMLNKYMNEQESYMKSQRT